MDVNTDRILVAIAICIAVVAVAISCGLFLPNQDHQEQDTSEGNFTDAQIVDLVDKLMGKGGTIHTTSGSLEISSSRWTIDIEDRVLICHAKSYNQDFYIPFDSIDYIWVYR